MTRDEFLTEKMGECWHEGKGISPTMQECIKCGKTKSTLAGLIVGYGDWNPNFSTWEGFGKLWNWAKEQKWWNRFWTSQMGGRYNCVAEHLIHPDRFADAVARYLGWREK